MKRIKFGLTDIERRHEEEQRRFRNCIRALLIVALLGSLINYVTQIGNF